MTILFLILIVFFTSGCIWCIICEKRDFNNGICPYCGNKLRHFDDDSQGGQGWCCDECNHTAWISWFKRNNKTREYRSRYANGKEL